MCSKAADKRVNRVWLMVLAAMTEVEAVLGGMLHGSQAAVTRGAAPHHYYTCLDFPDGFRMRQHRLEKGAKWWE